jgi:hypothetical protein
MGIKIDKKSFKKMFPSLSDELDLKENKVPIDSLRQDSEAAEKTTGDEMHHFSPTVIDFVRRCETEKEAEDIIAYLERRGEVTKEYAEQLRTQLKKDGVRSFGPKKEENYYFKKCGLC